MPLSLKQSVEEALQAYSPLRTSRAEITVAVDDGQVTLSGYVPSGSIKRMAGILAGSVQGVNGIVNDLLADPDLERSVAMALAANSRTRLWPIRVRAELGNVQLQGQVPDEDAAQVALEVARQVQGPRRIFSALEVSKSLELAA
ncbi:MAG: BON domain-containing protein [Anaerolineae bacterium]